jgi:UDP-2,3-diacylglucosamine hydrolase
MRTLHVKNKDNFKVISDVHLRSPDDQTTALFLHTLKNIDHVDAIFLLGDIFDFFAATNFFFKMWENVFSAFRSLKEKGIAVYFIEGNHDFGFEYSKDSFLKDCFTEFGDMIIELEHSKLGKIILRHGDDIVCPKSYLTFRKIVKSNCFQRLATFFLHGFLLHFIFSRYAKISRKQEKYRPMSGVFLKSCILNYLKTIIPSPQVLIIGHIHCFIDKMVDQTKFLCGPDWFSTPSYLDVSQEGTFKRIFIGEKTCQIFDF